MIDVRINTIELAVAGNPGVVKRGQYVASEVVRSKLEEALQEARRIESDAASNAASILKEAVSSTDDLLGRRLAEVLSELDRQIATVEQRLLQAMGQAVVSHVEETMAQMALEQFVAYVVRHVRVRMDGTSVVSVSVSPYDYPDARFDPVGMSNPTAITPDPEVPPGAVRIQIGTIALNVEKAALIDYLAQRCRSMVDA